MSALNWQKAFGFIQQSKPELALVLLNKLKQANPVHPQVYHGLGIVCLQKSEFNQAYEYLALAQPSLKEDATFANHFGLSLHRLQRLDEALVWLKKATELMPEEAGFWANYAYVFESKKDWPAMECAFKEALKLEHQSLEFALGLAVALRQQSHSLAALQQLMRFSTSQDEDFYKEWLLNIWLAYGEQKTLKTLDTLSSKNADFYVALGDYFDEQLNRDKAAVGLLKTLYQRALSLKPTHSYSQYMLDLLDESTRQSLQAAPADYVESLYDAHAEQFETQLVNKLGYEAPDWFAHELKQYLQPQTPIKLLDLGCGTGLFAQALAQQGFSLKADGVDISANMLKQAQAKELYSRCVKQDINSFLTQSDDESYELISALDVLIYQGEYHQFLAHTKKALAHNGYFVITLECAENANQPYMLDKSGRFKHGLNAFISQAQSLSFKIIKQHQTCLRMEDDQKTQGAYLVFQA